LKTIPVVTLCAVPAVLNSVPWKPIVRGTDGVAATATDGVASVESTVTSIASERIPLKNFVVIFLFWIFIVVVWFIILVMF
jgi:t-SNARE complex subunit (syntaxin)